MKLTIRHALKPANKNYSIIIPAAGLGRRMKSFGPKCCIRVKNDMTVLDNQIRHIHKNIRKSEIVVVVGDKYEKIKSQYGSRSTKVIFNPDYQTTNVTSSIALGLNHCKYQDVIIIYGDLVFNSYALKAPFGSESMIISDSHGFMDEDEVGVVVVNNQVENMMYDLSEKWAQIVYLTGKELKVFKELSNNRAYHNHFGFELINMTINAGGKFARYSPPRMKIIDLDSSKDIERIPLII